MSRNARHILWSLHVSESETYTHFEIKITFLNVERLSIQFKKAELRVKLWKQDETRVIELAVIGLLHNFESKFRELQNRLVFMCHILQMVFSCQTHNTIKRHSFYIDTIQNTKSLELNRE